MTKIITLPCFDIQVFLRNDGTGTIDSTLGRGEDVDALESLILAHACAGIDIESPAYLEGIKTAVDAITNNQPDGTKLAGNLDSLWAAITLCKRTLFLLFNACVDLEKTVVKAREVEEAIEGVFVQRKKTAIDELKAEEKAAIEAIDEKERCSECNGVGKEQHALVTSGKLDWTWPMRCTKCGGTGRRGK